MTNDPIEPYDPELNDKTDRIRRLDVAVDDAPLAVSRTPTEPLPPRPERWCRCRACQARALAGR